MPLQGQTVQRARLILGECLGGEDEEGATLRIGDLLRQRGELVAQALAARRAGADHHILGGPQQVVGRALMAVQRANACREQRRAQLIGKVVRQLRRPALARGLVGQCHDLLVAALAEERAQALLHVAAGLGPGAAPVACAGVGPAHASILLDAGGSTPDRGIAGRGVPLGGKKGRLTAPLRSTVVATP